MKIGDKDYLLKFGLNQSILYCELRGISITQMNEDFASFANGTHTGSEIRDLIWSALKDGARFNKTEFKYNNFDVGDIMEEIDPTEITNALKTMAGTLPKVKKGVDKKKAT